MSLIFSLSMSSSREEMMAERPLIAVTGPDRGGLFAWLMTWLAVRRAGGQAVRLSPGRDWRAMRFSGLILGGGSDISPENYGEEIKAIETIVRERDFSDRVWSVAQLLLRLLLSVKLSQPQQDGRRDQMERELCLQAREQEVPILGICRGAQMINVAFGGSLHQDTRTFYTEKPQVYSIFPRKHVRLEEDSRLSEILDVSECVVNSLHDQAVKRLGNGLKIVAREANDVVQAIEDANGSFVFGVQWHPEYLPQSYTQQRLFRALVAAARA